MTKATWEDIAQTKRAAVLAQIPQEWILKHVTNDITNTADYLDTILPENENSITDKSMLELLELLKTGEMNAIDITMAYCHRAALAHQLLNNCSEIFFDRAIKRAKELDHYYTIHGKLSGPLHGIPVSLKDQVNLEGLDSAIGMVSKLNHPKTKEDESIVAMILQDAGAVFYVKTTTPMAMMSCETFSNIYGQTLNALNNQLSPGGSSGGEASLIAAKGSIIGLSTDLGGSIRIPAAFNGLFGLRPSWGRIPYCKVENSFASQPLAPSVIGPSARYIEDVQYFVKTIIDARPWSMDPKSPPIEWRPYSEVKKLCFGFYKFNGVRTPHPPVLRGMDIVKKKLIEQGHTLIEWDPPVEHQFMRDQLSGIFFATGGMEILEECEKSGEPLIPQLNGDFPAPITTTQHWDQAAIQYDCQQKYQEYWNSSVKDTGTGRPVDAVLSPVWDTCSMPVGDPRYDLTSRNTYPISYLNLTAVTVPVTFVDKSVDKRVDEFQGLNSFDDELQSLYDPELYEGMPIMAQVICGRYEEEKALAIAQVVYEATHS